MVTYKEVNMDNTIEIIREARKAGMQVALIMFFCFLAVSGLFGYFIYMTYQTPPTGTIEATQTTKTGNNTVNQGIK